MTKNVRPYCHKEVCAAVSIAHAVTRIGVNVLVIEKPPLSQEEVKEFRSYSFMGEKK